MALFSSSDEETEAQEGYPWLAQSRFFFFLIIYLLTYVFIYLLTYLFSGCAAQHVGS